MLLNELKIFRILLIVNAITSLIITYLIILYNIENMSSKVLFVLFYALLWFFSLYKVYNLSKVGLYIYISLVILGFLLNILANHEKLNKLYNTMSLLEHLVIGGIITFAFFTKIRKKFN